MADRDISGEYFDKGKKAAHQLDMMAIQLFYKRWCERTNRGGGVLIGSSIKELLTTFVEQLSIPQVATQQVFTREQVMEIAKEAMFQVKSGDWNTFSDLVVYMNTKYPRK